MKVEVLTQKIKVAISGVERITGKNLSLPVLSCILITAKGNRMYVRATNLSIGAEFVFPANVLEEGVVAIPGGVLSQILSYIQEEKINIESSQGGINVTAGKIRTVIQAQPHEDFPDLPKVSSSVKVSLPLNNLIEGIQSVLSSAASSDIKPEISSVFVYSSNKELVCVATDSFRLAEKKVRVTNGECPGIIVPARSMAEVVRILGSAEKGKEVMIIVGDNQVSFEGDGFYVTSRLVQGSFPDYQQIIPKKSPTSATCLVSDLNQALRVTQLFSDKFHNITMKITPRVSEISIESKNAGVGESAVSVTSSIEGPGGEVSLNHRYLTESLPSLHDESILISMNSSNQPLVIRGVSDRSFLYLIMPMHR